PTTPAVRATPPRRGGEVFLTLPSCEGGHDATTARRGGLAALEPHHPGASRHPASTRRGSLSYLALLRRRARRDNVAEGWSSGARTPPPRRFAPPLLDEAGKSFLPCPPVKEGTTRQRRGGVVDLTPRHSRA